jgi:hypothetical protein
MMTQTAVLVGGGIDGGEEKYRQVFGGETLRKETTLKTKAWMRL